MGRNKFRQKYAILCVCKYAYAYIAWLSPPRGLKSSNNPVTVRKTWSLNIILGC